MSRNQIKWFAMLMMVIDHLAVAFLPVNTPLYFVCRGVFGRIAYPLFIVLFLEGMQRSRHLQRKAIDLCLFALVSEVFFDRALWGSWYFAGAQNVMWSWLLGLFLVMGCMYFRKCREDCTLTRGMQTGITVIWLLVVCMLAAWFRVDYGIAGVLCMFAGYCWMQARPSAALWQTGMVVAVTEAVLTLQPGVLLAVVVLSLYQPEKDGRKPFTAYMKYGFYAVYPVHLAVIAAVRMLIGA